MRDEARIRALLSCQAFLSVSMAFILMSAPLLMTGQRVASERYRQIVLEIQKHIGEQDFPGALALLTKAKVAFPSDGGIDNLLGVVEIQQGHRDEAARAFSAAIEHSPKLAGAYLNLGRIYMEKAADDAKDREAGLAVYEKLLRLEPNNSEANFQLAMLLMWDGKYQRSLDHLAKLPAEEQGQIGAEVVACGDEAALGHKEAADKAAVALVANADLTEQDAMEVLPALRVAHRADLIDSIFSAVKDRGQLSTNGLRILGLAQEGEGKLDAARATLEAVFAASPKPVVVLVDLTRVAKAAGDYQGALGYLAHARDLSPKDASLPYEFGVICLRLSLLGEARKAMEEAVKLSPENADYNLGMGTVSSFAQDPTGAIPYLEKAHALRPGDPVPVLMLGTTYFRAKNFEAAGKWLTQAAGDPRTAAEAHGYLGRIARQEGRLDDAAKELTLANNLAPDRADVLAELGQVSIARKQFGEAQGFLDRAVKIDPENYLANFALLQLYARTADPRRDEQSKRFDTIKDKSEEQYRDMMRIINIRPAN